jgi:hypothetical protein
MIHNPSVSSNVPAINFHIAKRNPMHGAQHAQSTMRGENPIGRSM